MKEQFTDKLRLNKENEQRLVTINQIVSNYAQQGYKLTLRQLYYQLVTENIIENKEAEYSKLSSLLVKGRMAGIVDWAAIEDRIRIPFIPYYAKDPADAINDILAAYRLDRQKDQEVHIELWVEKDALSGVLKPITSEYHIQLMVNRGYSSCTAIHDAYKRFLPFLLEEKEVKILYLGDHDPSGLDMIRDIKSRLIEMFTGSEDLQNGYNELDEEEMKSTFNRLIDMYDFGEEKKFLTDFGDGKQFDPHKAFAYDIANKLFSVVHIGLTMEQIQEFNPPPNPAKITDPRAKWYIAQHGQVSWEVDALKPEVLNELVRNNIEENIDMDEFEKVIKQEEKDKRKLKKVAKTI